MAAPGGGESAVEGGGRIQSNPGDARPAIVLMKWVAANNSITI